MSNLVTLRIDDLTVQVPKGTLIVDAAKRVGLDIPVFCYHPKLDPVGMCRMCLVEVGRVQRDRATREIVRDDQGQPKIAFGPKLETACTTPVEAGMVVIGVSAKVKDARDDVIEFLLTSHPLDCPVCDKGGECPLQNLTMRHGSGTSRFIFDEKQHLAKHVPLGTPEDALIYLDRERCIQCARCTRFQAAVVGEPVIGFFERGRKLQIVTHSEPGFDSVFSGNTTDICPVGALTTADFRFKARPWELEASASICPHCLVGCDITFNTRRNGLTGQFEIRRVLPRQNEQVNEIWICDKGRFGHHFAQSPERLKMPLVRNASRGELVEASWDEALALVAGKLKAAGDSLYGLAGDRLSNEDLYAFRSLVSGVGGQAEMNSPMGGGDWVQKVGVGVGTNFSALGRGTAILVVASDLHEEAPIWWLRIKGAAKRGATLIVANGRPTPLDHYATHLAPYRYGSEVATVLGMLVAGSSQAADAFAQAENAMILFGREGLDLAGSSALAQACANLLMATDHYGRANNGLLAVWPHNNTQGAWDMGLLPAGDLAEKVGRARVTFIAGTDPVGDGAVSGEVLRRSFVVVSELFLTATAQPADVVLPAQAFAEREGTYTSGERRVQRFYPALPPIGQCQADWQICQLIGERLGQGKPKASAALVLLDIAQNILAYAGLTYEELAKVEKQWPVVGGVDLYYGGAAYENTQGLGVQLKSGAERGEAVGAGQVRLPSPSKRDGLTLVPMTLLFDRGTTFAPSRLMQLRIPAPFVELNATDAGSLGVKPGDRVRLSVDGREVEVSARVNGRAPQGVVLMPESLGPTVSRGAAAATVRKAE